MAKIPAAERFLRGVYICAVFTMCYVPFPMTHRQLFLGIFLLGTFLASCQRRPPAKPNSLLEWVEPGSAGFLLLDDLSKVASQFAMAFDKLSSPLTSPLLTQVQAGIAESFGFNPQQQEAWAKIGIAPETGALLFAEGRGLAPMLVLACNDPKKFDAFLKSHLQRMNGADNFTTKKHSSTMVSSLAQNIGGTSVPILHWSHLSKKGGDDGRAKSSWPRSTAEPLRLVEITPFHRSISRLCRAEPRPKGGWHALVSEGGQPSAPQRHRTPKNVLPNPTQYCCFGQI